MTLYRFEEEELGIMNVLGEYFAVSLRDRRRPIKWSAGRPRLVGVRRKIGSSTRKNRAQADLDGQRKTARKAHTYYNRCLRK